MLSGLVQCTLCQGRMYGQRVDPEERSSYACNSGKTANHLAINARRLESLVSREVADYLFARAYRGAEAPEPTISEWDKEEELATLGTRIDELMAAHSGGVLSGEVVFPQVSKLEEQRAELRRERREFYSAQPVSVTNVEEAWTRSLVLNDTLSPFESKQLAIRSEVEGVWISKPQDRQSWRSEEAFKTRVSIVWKEPHLDVEPLTEDEWAEARLRADSDPEMIDRLWKLYTMEDD